MSLLDVLRAGVKIADGITKPFQGTVIYKQCLTKDEFGNKSLNSSGVPLKAIIDQTQRQVRTLEGQFMVVSASMDFLDVAAVKTATGGLGFSIDDEFTLPDGKKRPTLSAGGFVDAGTTRPVVSTVMLG